MRRYAVALLALGVLGLAGFWLLTQPATTAATDLPEHTADAAAGAMVFAAGGCVSCHAAPGATEEAKLSLAGGLELKTPFGTFVVPIISPDPEHGIGGWSQAEFVTAMMQGTSPDGAHYYPAFPYTSYARMEVADVMDLQAYIATLQPSQNVAPAHDLGFPFNISRGLGLWKRLYLRAEPVLPVPEDPFLARGQVLAGWRAGRTRTGPDAARTSPRTRAVSAAGPKAISPITWRQDLRQSLTARGGKWPPSS